MRDACRQAAAEGSRPGQRAPWCLPLALLLAWLLLLQGTFASAAPATSGERRLQEASRAYNRGEYDTVINLLRPLLYPAIQLSSEEQVIQAYRLLGISYIFEKDRSLAEKQFMAILALRPDFRFDPLNDPVAAVELLDDLKRRNAAKLKAIRERERLEEEQRRQAAEAERRRLAEEQRRALQRPGLLIERTIVRRPYWINFVPFGAGQFQNGHRRKGFTLLATQLTLGALSLSTALAYRISYPDGRVSTPEDYDRARGLAITQVVSGALFFGTVAYGIIDALVYHRAETVSEQRKPLASLPGRLRLAPLALPGGSGVGLGGTF